MAIFQMALILAAFLCSLVAGFLFAFAIVTMPGLKRLNDRDFIQAFQAMDAVIQNNQPVFLSVWLGSAVALVMSAVLGIGHLVGDGRLLLIMATLVFLCGVQLPTIVINIPLNNKLQTVDVNEVNATTLDAARKDFEAHWNRWNAIRTAFASLTSALLLILLFRL